MDREIQKAENNEIVITEEERRLSPNSKPPSDRDMEVFSKSMNANVVLGSNDLSDSGPVIVDFEKGSEIASARIRAMAPRDPLEEFLISSMLSSSDHAARLWIQARAQGRPDCITALGNAASKAQTRSMEAAKLLLDSRRKPPPTLHIGEVNMSDSSQAVITGETSVPKK